MSAFRALIVASTLALACCAAETWPGGIQARLVWSKEQGVRVLDVPADGAAARAGMQVGDRVVAIEGQPVEPLDASQVHQLLSGEVGSHVNVTVERGGDWVQLRIERTPYQPSAKTLP